MTDRKKVIKGLHCCSHTDGVNCIYCPYDNKDTDCTALMAMDVLALLKEQEAVKPIYNEEKYGDHLPHCGNCEKVLPNNAVYGKVNFCHYCGQAVKWE